MSKIQDVVTYMQQVAPPALQESYDNAQLLTGQPDSKVQGLLITLDCTEEVVDEAIALGANLIVAHHPVIFGGLKKLTGSNYVERTIIKAIKHDVAILAVHTNLDKVIPGVSHHLAGRIGLQGIRVLQPERNLRKLVTFIPTEHTRQVLDSLHAAGAGNIGNYSECSFKITGKGYFKPNEAANPAIGQKHVREEVTEDRVEVIYPAYLSGAILSALRSAHPYEEVAYYETELTNANQENGLGAVGELPEPMSTEAFLQHLQSSLDLSCIRHTPFSGEIKKVAVCGGSGAFLLGAARAAGADAYVTADVKYHEFFDAENQLLFCDIGHYESEVGTKDLLYDLLSKKFTNFALHLSKVITNPIRYFY